MCISIEYIPRKRIVKSSKRIVQNGDTTILYMYWLFGYSFFEKNLFKAFATREREKGLSSLLWKSLDTSVLLDLSAVIQSSHSRCFHLFENSPLSKRLRSTAQLSSKHRVCTVLAPSKHPPSTPYSTVGHYLQVVILHCASPPKAQNSLLGALSVLGFLGYCPM